ncbi:MAG TPA: pantoate--beta-alanine ligase [Gemmatimonadales bacterium]|nr:pantoate--beta-alanine ligase [Gemmatimonadales bacterium]
MEVVVALEEVRARVREAKRNGRRIGFVPTMGALHAGHLSLVQVARSRADLVAMSIFVNPLQFGPAEDFARYPRDPERDRGLAAAGGVDLLWSPEQAALYPAPPRVTVAPGPAGERLEGASRPGHFAGVLTVVLKLFALVEPETAVFGRKDFQQAALIRAMVRDFNLPVEIVVAPTVRGHDGVALSSRNVYLDPPARAAATALCRALRRGVEAYRGGERRASALAEAARRVLAAQEGVVPDYVACAAPDDLAPLETVDAATVLAVAARVGGTRLIDNVVLGEGLEGDVHVVG